MENFGPKKDTEKVKRNPITGVYTYEEKKKPSPIKPYLNWTFEEQKHEISTIQKIEEAFSKHGSVCPCDKCTQKELSVKTP